MKQKVMQYIPKLKEQEPKDQERVLNLSYRIQPTSFNMGWSVSNKEAREKPRYRGRAPSLFTDGVLDLNLGRDDDPFAPLIEEGSENNTLGVIMIN